MQKKRGISLIVLIITIIVMVILAGAIILTLNNNGIINKASEAVEKTNLATIKELTQMAWAEAYVNGARTEAELKAGVDAKMAENKIDVSKYDIVVTTKGVTVALKGETVQIPEEWKTNVINIVDTVPIPKGFVASQATGENTKVGGLVIYEGTTPVTDANVEDAKRERNQYVWVPVNNFETEFVRQNFGQSDTISNTLGSDWWEVVLDTTTNMPLPTQSSTYMTIETPEGGITNTLAEVQAMYESVKEYKGFYIARYEAGLKVKEAVEGSTDIGQRTEKGTTGAELPGIKEGTKVYSMMNKIPYNYIPWTWNSKMNEDTNGAVEVARRMYPETNTNYGVVSTLTYGVQWDRTLAWWKETKAQNGTGDVTIECNYDLENSINYGNYKNNAIPNSTFNVGTRVSKDDGKTYTTIDSTYSKTSSEYRLLTTGATEEARVNNIYDMAGNLDELTMGGYSTNYRLRRGGYYDNIIYGDTYFPVSERNSINPDGANCGSGFRPSLYIKK